MELEIEEVQRTGGYRTTVQVRDSYYVLDLAPVDFGPHGGECMAFPSSQYGTVYEYEEVWRRSGLEVSKESLLRCVSAFLSYIQEIEE